MTHYHNLPEGDRQGDDARWLPPDTGDVFRRRERFFFSSAGPTTCSVCGGENIYPGEVEKMLERNHPAIHQAAAAGARRAHGPLSRSPRGQHSGAELDEQAVRPTRWPMRRPTSIRGACCSSPRCRRRHQQDRQARRRDRYQPKRSRDESRSRPRAWRTDRLNYESNFPDPRPGEGDDREAVKAASLNP